MKVVYAPLVGVFFAKTIGLISFDYLKYYRALAVVLVLLILVTLISWPTFSARPFLATNKIDYQQPDRAGVYTWLTDVLRQQPNSQLVLNSLIEVSRSLGDLELSSQLEEKSLRIDPALLEN